MACLVSGSCCCFLLCYSRTYKFNTFPLLPRLTHRALVALFHLKSIDAPDLSDRPQPFILLLDSGAHRGYCEYGPTVYLSIHTYPSEADPQTALPPSLFLVCIITRNNVFTYTGSRCRPSTAASSCCFARCGGSGASLTRTHASPRRPPPSSRQR